ncbi:ArsA family ATPase [Cytobacillus spongiae]|uniref:ArsA family ATPase n=1 Tax=Cytobacillus spongiae TaxID=2901381 RepID=UPI001F219A6B|nr:ArsA family ATPase [Cytobacillus spongiae]UII57674.1 ArsA family ATPase [Cytobacillus spongiae]
MNLHQKVYFIGGKGGVGKSTTSSALAYLLANQGQKVLLVSTDPAHNTGDLFHIEAKGEKMNVMKGLDLLEIHAEAESKRYINEVKKNLKGLVKATMVDEVHRQIDLAAAAPGADEAALFDKLTSIILEEKEHYDSIVFDTAPTGHTIRLLTLPELMGVWIDGMLQKRKKLHEQRAEWMNDGEELDDPIYETLQKRKSKFQQVRKVLLDPSQTEFLFVLNAERLPILETRKAIDTLESYDLKVRTIIVNKVIPSTADGAFMERRRENEAAYLHDIKQSFSEQLIVKLPLLAHDISQIEHLHLMAAELNIGLMMNTRS